MAEAARVLDYEDYGYAQAIPAAPAGQRGRQAVQHPAQGTYSKEQVRPSQRAAAQAQAQRTPGISLFAIAGSVVVCALMVLVVLAQISYNQSASEVARLNGQLVALNEQHRRLEITFERVIDMNEIERYARDVLGMTRPSSRQIGVITATASDRGEVLAPPDRGELQSFGAFISSLLGHFR